MDTPVLVRLTGLLGIATMIGLAVLLSANRRRISWRLVGSALGLQFVLSYALLGFANFSSIAIQIGGIGGIAPERRGDLARLGLKAMIGGNLAAFMSASLAGILIG